MCEDVLKRGGPCKELESGLMFRDIGFARACPVHELTFQ